MEANKAVTPLVDALAAMWDDEGVRGGPAYIQMRDLARALECSRGDLVKALKVARDCIALLAEAPSTFEIIDAALTKAGAA